MLGTATNRLSYTLYYPAIRMARISKRQRKWETRTRKFHKVSKNGKTSKTVTDYIE